LIVPETDHDTSRADAGVLVFRRVLTRKRAAFGLIGLVAAGAGTILTIEHGQHDESRQVTTATDRQSTQSAPVTGPGPTGAAPVRPRSAGPAALTTSATPVSDAERIASARAAAKHSRPIQHPLPAVVPATPASDLRVKNIGSAQAGQTLRIVSAKSDLTGQDELAWVADGGAKVGAAWCSQNFRFADQAKPQHKPNLLVCWHTSPARSVYTVMVNMAGKPSRAASAAAIAKEWRKLG
jgi:hypothetical protein